MIVCFSPNKSKIEKIGKPTSWCLAEVYENVDLFLCSVHVAYAINGSYTIIYLLSNFIIAIWPKAFRKSSSSFISLSASSPMLASASDRVSRGLPFRSWTPRSQSNQDFFQPFTPSPPLHRSLYPPLPWHRPLPSPTHRQPRRVTGGAYKEESGLQHEHEPRWLWRPFPTLVVCFHHTHVAVVPFSPDSLHVAPSPLFTKRHFGEQLAVLSGVLITNDFLHARHCHASESCLVLWCFIPTIPFFRYYVFSPSFCMVTMAKLHPSLFKQIKSRCNNCMHITQLNT